MIKANPYIYGRPVMNKEMFFGREDVFEFLRRHLIGAYQDNVIMLYGQRRTGKTSILYQILNNHRLGNNYVPVLISLEGLGDAETNAQVFWTVANEIAMQLHTDIPKQEKFDALNNYFRYQFLGENVRPLLNGRKLLLMIDEYVKLEVCVDNPHTKVNPTIFLQFRHLMQHYDWISFIWVGSHNLKELKSEYWKEFTNSIYHTISFLDPKSAKELIEHPATKCSVNYTPDATQRLLEISGLHPLFLQALCHFAYANSAEKEEITIQDVETAIEPCIEAIRNLYVSIWQDFRDDEKMILSTTAHVNTHLINVSDIVGQLDHFKVNWDFRRIKQVMQQLEHKEVLKRNELQQYQYCTPFFEECVRIYQSLETTLEKLNIEWEKDAKFIHEPEIVKAENNLRIAEEYFQLGKIGKAENTFQYVIANYPDYIGGWLRFGNFYELQEKWDDAIDLYKKRLKEYQNSIDASNAIGILLKKRYQFKRALQQFQVSLDIDNFNNIALANIDEINQWLSLPAEQRQTSLWKQAMKAFVPGYKYDIFVSFVSIDDQPTFGGEEGWVTMLIKNLRINLAQKLGSEEAISLWSLHQLPGNVPISAITNILSSTATFIVVLSPAYVMSDWGRKQINDFLSMAGNRIRADSRVFVVEKQRLEDGEHPPELRNLRGYPFWIQEDPSGRPPQVVTPQRDTEVYFERLNDLSYDLMQELQKLKYSDIPV